jgi:uncharacterized MAPEG superfamily protein|tara:strand:+ start:569 stop:931 length:363 start_codon:yes stop_codon:yes gene_type:complete
MTSLILLSLLLALTQVILPILLNTKNLEYLLSSRDEPIEVAPFVGRANRAFLNLLESLPIFLVLAVLSIIQEVDNYDLATYWLGLRFLYFPLYVFNVIYIRSLTWMVSAICLVLMAVSLI